MCGIAGVIGRTDSNPVVRRMIAALRHRGPDDVGYGEVQSSDGEQRGTFGHARLSIIDLSAAGHQPMATADGRFAISYNGEVYNFAELREGLRSEGVQFRSETDTEVVLVGCALHGISYASKLRGMFAFALWDRDREVCWLARDQFGVKPLYYTVRGGAALFASEVRAILASGVVPRNLSRTGIASYLTAGSVQEPLTVLQDVFSVPPGAAVELRRHGSELRGKIHQFATPPQVNPREVEGDRASALRLLRSALRESVKYHMVSDVPISFFLSGGLDSSAVVALASSLGVPRLETFTVTFFEDRFNEADPARLVARRFKTRHHEIPLSSSDLLRSLPDAFAAMDQPSMDGINTYVVSRAVAAHGLKVVLSGLGADELFGGYPSFARARTARRLRVLPRYARESLARLASASGDIRAAKVAMLLSGSSPAAAAYRASRTLLPGQDVQRLTGIAAEIPCETPEGNRDDLEQVAALEMSGYMRATLLRDTDVFSMAHGLEVRVPFVDRGVESVARRIDPSLKWSGAGSKPLLREAVRDLLPDEVWQRRKQGFTLPWDIWLRESLRDEIAIKLEGRNVADFGLDAGSVRTIWSRFLERRAGIGWSRPWALYTLIRWAEANELTMPERSEADAGPVFSAL